MADDTQPQTDPTATARTLGMAVPMPRMAMAEPAMPALPQAPQPQMGVGQAVTGEAIQKRLQQQQQNYRPPPKGMETSIPGYQRVDQGWIQKAFEAKGLPPDAAAAIAHNAMVESGGDPTIPGDRDANGNPTSHGLFQHHGERWEALKAYAAENGLDPHSPQTQVDFAWKELQGMPRLLTQLTGPGDENSKYLAFRLGFERPQNVMDPFQPTAYQMYSMGMGNQILQQMMRDAQEGKARVAKLEEGYKPIQIEAPPKTPHTDPLETFGSLAGVFATLASAFTRTPATAAMNALAGAMKASKEANWEDYKAQYDQWKYSTELMFKAHERQAQDIRDAMEMMSKNVAVGKSMLETVLALSGDERAQRLAARQEYMEFGRFQDERDLNAAKLKLMWPVIQAEEDLRAATENLRYLQQNHAPEDQIQQARENVREAEQIWSERSRTASRSGASTMGTAVPVTVTRKDGSKYTTLANQDRLTPGIWYDSNTGERIVGNITPTKEERAQEKFVAGRMTDEDAMFAAKQYLAGDKSVLMNLGRGAQGAENVLKIKHFITQLSTEKGLSPADVAANIAEFNGTVAAFRTLGTRTANLGVSINEMRTFVPMVIETSKKIKRTDYPTINAVILAAEQGTGSTEVVQYSDAIQALQNAYTLVMSRSGVPSDFARKRAIEVLQREWSQGQIEAGVEILIREADAASEAVKQTGQELRQNFTTSGQRGAAPPAQSPDVPPSLRGKPGLQRSPSTGLYRDSTGQIYNPDGTPR